MLEQSQPAGSPPVVPEERRRLILAMLGERGSVTVATVERAFGISAMTARRDLAILAQEGRLRRTHGGAVLPELASHEDSFRSRLEQETEQKRRIGSAIAASAEAERDDLRRLLHDELLRRRAAARAGRQRHAADQLAAGHEPGGGQPRARTSSSSGSAALFRPLTQSFVGAETVRAIEGFYADRSCSRSRASRPRAS